MKSICLTAFACILFGSYLGQAQTIPIESAPRMKSEGISIGGIILKDSYLSPLNYAGISLGYYNETNRAYRSSLGQKYFRLTLGQTDNPAGNAKIYVLHSRLEGARQFYLYKGSLGTFYLGPSYNVGIGGLYSSRNGNNPATFHSDASLALSFGYAYRLRWKISPMLFRLSTRLDLVGTHWGQDFGESYYEMTYLTKSISKKFNFTHLGNAYAQDIRLSLDIPVYKRLVLNIRGEMRLQSWTVNQIDNRRREYVFGVGFTNYMQSVGGKEWLKESHSIPF